MIFILLLPKLTKHNMAMKVLYPWLQHLNMQFNA